MGHYAKDCFSSNHSPKVMILSSLASGAKLLSLDGFLNDKKIKFHFDSGCTASVISHTPQNVVVLI